MVINLNIFTVSRCHFLTKLLHMKVCVRVAVSRCYYDKGNVYSSEGDANQATKGKGVGKTSNL